MMLRHQPSLVITIICLYITSVHTKPAGGSTSHTTTMPPSGKNEKSGPEPGPEFKLMQGFFNKFFVKDNTTRTEVNGGEDPAHIDIHLPDDERDPEELPHPRPMDQDDRKGPNARQSSEDIEMKELQVPPAEDLRPAIPLNPDDRMWPSEDIEMKDLQLDDAVERAVLGASVPDEQGVPGRFAGMIPEEIPEIPDFPIFIDI